MVSIGVLNLSGMIPMRIARCVVCQAGRVFHTELTGDIGHDIGGNGGGMRQKRPQKPYRPQLDGKAQARVIALAAINELVVPVIKVEIARQLRWRWLFGIASVTALLLLGQEL